MESLLINTSLHVLILKDNGIKDDGVLHIANALLKNKSLLEVLFGTFRNNQDKKLNLDQFG